MDEYAIAYEESGKAIALFTKIQADYRARRIGDKEYIAGRRIYEAAMKKFDAAYAKAAEAQS